MTFDFLAISLKSVKVQWLGKSTFFITYELENDKLYFFFTNCLQMPHMRNWTGSPIYLDFKSDLCRSLVPDRWSSETRTLGAMVINLFVLVKSLSMRNGF